MADCSLRLTTAGVGTRHTATNPNVAEKHAMVDAGRTTQRKGA